MPSNGTWTGTAAYVTDKYGRPSSAGSFDGSTNYVSLPGAGSYNYGASSSWTIEGWFYCSAYGSANTYFVSQIGTSTSFAVGLDSTGHAYVMINTMTSGATSSGTYSTGAWHHFSLNVTSGTSYKVYIDGVLSITGSGTLYVPIASSTTYIAGGTSTTNYFNGYLDDVSFYSTVQRSAAFSPPTIPTLNGAANLIDVYHLDGDATDSVGSVGTFTAIGTGNWTTAGTWSHTGTPVTTYPTASDTTILAGHYTVTISAGTTIVAGSIFNSNNDDTLVVNGTLLVGLDTASYNGNFGNLTLGSAGSITIKCYARLYGQMTAVGGSNFILFPITSTANYYVMFASNNTAGISCVGTAGNLCNITAGGSGSSHYGQISSANYTGTYNYTYCNMTNVQHYGGSETAFTMANCQFVNYTVSPYIAVTFLSVTTNLQIKNNTWTGTTGAFSFAPGTGSYCTTGQRIFSVNSCDAPLNMGTPRSWQFLNNYLPGSASYPPILTSGQGCWAKFDGNTLYFVASSLPTIECLGSMTNNLIVFDAPGLPDPNVVTCALTNAWPDVITLSSAVSATDISISVSALPTFVPANTSLFFGTIAGAVGSSGAAAAGAISLTVVGLSAAIPSGGVLTFANTQAVLSSAASAGATTLSINSLPAAVVNNAAFYYNTTKLLTTADALAGATSIPIQSAPAAIASSLTTYPYIFSGNICQSNGQDNNGAFFYLASGFAPTVPASVNCSGNLLIRNLKAGVQGTSGSLFNTGSANGYTNVVFEHNTFDVDGGTTFLGAIFTGDLTTNPYPGVFNSIRSNIGYGVSAAAGRNTIFRMSGTATNNDVALPANVGYNGGINLDASSSAANTTKKGYVTGSTKMFSVAPLADTTDVNADPVFSLNTAGFDSYLTASSPNGIGQSPIGTDSGNMQAICKVNGASFLYGTSTNSGGTMCYMQANPSSSSTVRTAILNQYKPTASAYKQTYPGDLSTITNMGAVLGSFGSLLVFIDRATSDSFQSMGY